jgi:predicted DsbA family dithiol-disulfide isomerase
MSKPKIKIDVVSDVVCPWCYIGKRRLEKAVDQLKDKYEFELEYHPFELNPGMPVEGTDQKKYLTNKFGGEDRYKQITDRVTSVATEEGLRFDFKKQKVSPNTREAHRIIQFAKQEGKQPEVKEAFMKAYFEEGIDLSKKENLIDVAVQAGVLKEKVEKLLSTDEGLAEVALAESELQKLGITGVPFYIINNQYGISGAQPSESFVQAFEDIGDKTELTGDVCDVEDKNC